jgi:phosphatidylglycerophosphate synthase
LGLVRWLAVAIAILMGAEVIKCTIKSKVKLNLIHYLLFVICYLLLVILDIIDG